MARPITRDHLKKKKPIQERILVPADDAQMAKLEELRSSVSHAQFLGHENLEELKAELADYEDTVAETGYEFVFVGIGRPAYELLQRSFPPTAAQLAEDKDTPWDVEEFGPALCAQSCKNSDLTEAEWKTDIFNSSEWGPGEVRMLFDAALSVNTKRRVVELGN